MDIDDGTENAASGWTENAATDGAESAPSDGTEGSEGQGGQSGQGVVEIFGLDALIGDELQKYHEEKIRRDQGEEPEKRPGMKALKRFPKALLEQCMALN